MRYLTLGVDTLHHTNTRCGSALINYWLAVPVEFRGAHYLPPGAIQLAENVTKILPGNVPCDVLPLGAHIVHIVHIV
ncbi:MAG: hypothetical protein ACXVDF_25240, partial [Ktedonobacterales bacterium]